MKLSHKPHLYNISADNLLGIYFKILTLKQLKLSLQNLFNNLEKVLVSYLLSRTYQQESFQILKGVLRL